MADSVVSIIVFLSCFSAYISFQFAYRSWFAPIAFVPYLLFYQGGLDTENYRSLINQNVFDVEVMLTYIFSYFPDIIAFRLLVVLSVCWYLTMFGFFVRAYVQDQTSRQIIFLYNFGFPFGAMYAFSSFRQFFALGFIFFILILAKSRSSKSAGTIFLKIITVLLAIGSHITSPIAIVNIMKKYTILFLVSIIYLVFIFLNDLGNFTGYLKLQTSNYNYYGTIMSVCFMGIMSYIGGYSQKVQLTYSLALILGCILSIFHVIPGVLFLRILVYVLPFMLVHMFKDKPVGNNRKAVLTTGYFFSYIWIIVLLIQMINRREFYFDLI